MSILNLLRRKKKTGLEEVFVRPVVTPAPIAFTRQSESSILIDMGDIVADADAGLSVHAKTTPGIPVYIPEIYADQTMPEARLLVDTSALQRDSLNMAVGNIAGMEDGGNLYGTVIEPADEPAADSTDKISETIPAAPERKRRYGHQEASLSGDKPDPFNDGIIIIAEWEHTEPGGVIGYDPGMNAVNNWMTERSSPLLIIDKAVNLTLQSADQEAAAAQDAGPDDFPEVNPQNFQTITTSADRFAINTEDYASLSTREIIDRVLAKWQGQEIGQGAAGLHKDKGVYNQNEIDAALKGLQDTLLLKQNMDVKD